MVVNYYGYTGEGNMCITLPMLSEEWDTQGVDYIGPINFPIEYLHNPTVYLKNTIPIPVKDMQQIGKCGSLTNMTEEGHILHAHRATFCGHGHIYFLMECFLIVYYGIKAKDTSEKTKITGSMIGCAVSLT